MDDLPDVLRCALDEASKRANKWKGL